jgi:GT2 family glycosyltransferase
MKKKSIFLCVGTQKAGTTTLHDILKQHPDIYLPKSKEAHFFDTDENYNKGLDWWLDTFFGASKNKKVMGTMTPEYLAYEEVPERIAKTLGTDIKIIIILRNPINRAYSHYLMSRRRGYEDHSFEKAISLEEERIKQGDFERSHFSYISRGKYYEQVKRYIDTFSKENILILKFEDDFLQNREETITKVLNFLGVENIPLTVDLKSNKATQPKFQKISKLIYSDNFLKKILRSFIKSSKVKVAINQFIDRLNQTEKSIPKLTKEEKTTYLNQYFIEDIKKLESYLKMDFSTWYADDNKAMSKSEKSNMTEKRKVAVVLLNYNSEEDLFVSTEQLKKQKNVDLTMIIVDNASSPESIGKIKAWYKIFDSHSLSGTTNEVFEQIENKHVVSNDISTFIVYNDENKGYSAGNNIGIKLADLLDVDAVLITNPDMRFENENYVAELSKILFLDDEYTIAGSKIVGLDGKDQSPLREATFWEEFFWIKQIFKPTSYTLPYKKDEIMTVPKVMGCCLLLRMDFLRDIGYFDEGTFLYVEEPILASQVKEKNVQMVFTPFIEAVHAHIRSEKGNSSKRMLLFIKSRKYYLKKYSGYNQIELMLLNFSYAVLAMLHYVKSKVKK